MPGFFPGSMVSSKPPPSLVPKCGACGLFKTCKSPKMEPTGKGKKRILLLGEAPGQTEDEIGRQFVGKTGQRLKRTLAQVGIDMTTDCWLTNSIICRPVSNATPTDAQIEYCRPILTKTIKDLNPSVIIPLGAVAVKSLIGGIWKEDPGSVSKWAGYQIPCQNPNVWITPTVHPSYVERSDNPVVDAYFERHLAAAGSLEGKPWEKPPDFKSRVEAVYKPGEAAQILDEMRRDGGPVAFDFETNTLKPEGDGLIVSCSVCHLGKRTIAYPWTGEAIQATIALLKAKNPKIASNLKFEDRWCWVVLGVKVRNWYWCTMTAAHVIDNRPGITSIKFQAFVHYGQMVYDDHIKPYLQAKKGKKINQILEEVDLHQLLIYNGLDSLLEYKVAFRQMKQMGYPFP